MSWGTPRLRRFGSVRTRSRAPWVEALLPFLALAVLVPLVSSGTAGGAGWLVLYLYAVLAAHFYGRNGWLLLGLLVASAAPLGLAALRVRRLDVGLGVVHVVFPTLVYHYLADLAERTRRVQAELARLGEERALERLRDERLALARAIHDGLGASLTAAIVQGQVAERAAGDDATASAAALARVVQRIEAASAELAKLDAGPSLGPVGRREALADLQGLAAEFGAAGPSVEVKIAMGEDDTLSSGVWQVLRQSAREATTNAVRHGHAARVAIEVVRRGERVAVTVEDDGEGLRGARPGFGRSGLAAAAQGLGGSARWQPRAPRGTRVTIDLPMRAS